MRVLLTVLSLAVALPSLAAAAGSVTADEARLWVRHVIPLPKEIVIPSAVTVPTAEVAILVRPGATDVELSAAEVIADAVGVEVGSGPAPQGAFVIRLGVAEPGTGGTEQLAELPNSDQAYLISPVGETQLLLSALTGRGVYHGARTLAALLKARAGDGTVTIPLARVRDWPDIAERGLWGGNATRDIEWMSAHKMNLVESHVRLGVDEEGKGVAQISQDMVDLGRRNALNVVPIITHLEQIAGTGIFTALPQTAGQGDPDRWARIGHVRPACWSHPDTVRVLGDWMVALASQEGVTDLCPWLSENAVKCECDRCAEQDQFALETAAILAGYERAKQVNPELGLRILLTQGSYRSNEVVLSMLPPGVGATYYDGGRTYDSSREPMIYPLLEEWAAQGNRLGCYPQLTASWRIVCPWSGPQFIKYRMTEFVDKGLGILCGYATPNNRLYDFNVAAAAEWSWNARGRDEREFAAAWATTRGLADPEAAADWAVMLGPVGWDVYGSRVPYSAFFGAAANMIRNRAQPALGQGMFRYFPTEQRFTDNLEICARAREIAERLEAPALIAETQVIEGYTRMLHTMYRMAMVLSAGEPPTDAQREALNDWMFDLSLAGMRVVDGLRDWEAACGEGLGGSRLRDTIDVTAQTTADVGVALRPLGVQDVAAGYLRTGVGGWETDDFEEQERVSMTWEVTGNVTGPGTYRVEFAYAGGWHGLNMFRAALASAPQDAPEELTEVVVDEHHGTAAHQNRDNIYTLQLDEHDPDLRYFLVADIRGTRSSDKPIDRRGCVGKVIMWRDRPPGEELRKPPLLPISEDEQARYEGPRFSGEGVRVGVVQGGYGSVSALEHLRQVQGVDAEPIHALTADTLEACEVVILPQPHPGGGLPGETAALLAEWVRGGGGLITTHDAVGYRGLPAIVPEVCAGGTGHVRDEGWRVEGEHPVTRGLPRDRTLARSYYDHILLEPGPQGTVAAVAVPGGAPVVVCGEAGEGRHVACGLALSIGEGDRDVPPTPDEAALLESAVRWAAGD